MKGRRRPPRVWLAGLLIVPMAAGFLVAGGGVGMAAGLITAATIVVIAMRAQVRGEIEVAEPGPGVAGGLLVLAIAPIEDPRTAGIVAAIADPGPEEAADEMLVVSPARSTKLQRWTDDLEQARFESQRALAVSLASLAAAGVNGEGQVGDGDPLQAAEDVLRSYAATEVVVVSTEGEYERQITELESRLAQPLRRVTIPP